MTPDHQVAIIGGGFSGIGAAILLDKAGFDDYLMIEEGDGVGGAWHWNTYPGVAVDIPSFSYQFSFEQRADWSRIYAPGRELKEYAEHCVDKYDVRRRTRLGTRIVAATFDDDGDLWRLRTDGGDEITARYVVGATGSSPSRSFRRSTASATSPGRSCTPRAGTTTSTSAASGSRSSAPAPPPSRWSRRSHRRSRT